MVVPREGFTTLPTLHKSVTVSVVLLPRKKKLKKDDSYSRHDGVRAGRGSPCAILLLWFSMAAANRLGSLGPLIRTCSR